mmetsp:Transcript_43877/g.50583  ORF Transcript_43877/g.50583 Transcript_43877/m.50583 type:complete len:127 (+) Transcript_43877:242-622(+)
MNVIGRVLCVVYSRVFTPLAGGDDHTTTMTKTTNDTNTTTTTNESRFLVTKIHWDDLDFPGTISLLHWLVLLSSLTSLDLSNNHFFGRSSIPDSFYSLTEFTQHYSFQCLFDLLRRKKISLLLECI